MMRRQEVTNWRAGGNPLRHDCKPPAADIGDLWRCPECDALWVYVTDMVGWCGWVRAGWFAKLRAKVAHV